jgi:AcrR family transcriptional regulator
VAERAGVSVGALYRYFANKEALVVELYRRYVSELRTRLISEFPIADIVGGSDVRELVRKTLALAFRLYSDRPGLRRVLVEQARKIPELVALRLEQEAEIRQVVGQMLGAFPGVRLPDTEAGAYLIRLFIESLIDDFLLYRPEDAAFDEARLIDAATDFILRYVTGRVE